MQKVLVLFMISFFVASCSKKIAPTAEVTFLTSKDGVINLRSIGYCKLDAHKDQCVDEAMMNAFRVLFYRGIPGSQQSTPLIVDDKNKAANDKFVKDFFQSMQYKSFITAYAPVSNPIRQRNQKKISVDLSINLVALKKELEQDKVTKPFGLY